MAEIFATSGEKSENVVAPTPLLQGLFIPGIDNPVAVDGFGIITPWGGGGTARKYRDYGIPTDISSQSTQLYDLASSLIPAEGGGISFGLEGPQGIQGVPGLRGLPGIVTVLGLNLPQNSNFLVALPHNLDLINDLGTAADKLIYTDAYNTYTEIAWTAGQSAAAGFKFWKAVDSDSDGSHLIAGVGNGGLYTSADSGVTWVERQPAGAGVDDWRAVASDADGSNLIAGNYGGRLYTSANYGVGWTERQPNGDEDWAWGKIVSDSDGSNLMVSIIQFPTYRLYTSANSGASWIERQPAGDVDKMWTALASDADGSHLIAGITTGRLYTSANSGANWTERQPAGASDKSWKSAASDDDGSHLIVGAYGGRLYTSANSGANWTERQPAGNNDKDWIGVASDSDGSHLVAIAETGRLYVSTDSGVSWTEERPAGDSNEEWVAVASDSDGSNLIVAINGRRLYTGIDTTLYSEATWAESALTSAGRAILDDTNAAAQATTLGLGTGNSPTWVGATLSAGPFDLSGKMAVGLFGTPIDVTATRKYGVELHYSGNDYDVTGIRSRAQLITSDTTATAEGGLFQAANNDGIDVGVLNGIVSEAIGKSGSTSATIGTMRGGFSGAEWGVKDTVTNLFGHHIRVHSLNAAGEGSFGTGYGLYIENEAVGGNGQALDAGIYFKETNLSAGNKAFTYGIDFSGGTYGSAEIKLSSGGTIGGTAGDVRVDVNGNLGMGVNPFYKIDTTEIGNSTGTFKIQPDVQGNVTIFEDTSIDNDVDGKSLFLYRKAMEGESYFRWYLDSIQNARFIWSGGDFIFSSDEASIKNIRFDENLHLGQFQANRNAFFRHYGYLTAPTAIKYIQWKVNDVTDNFELTRQDTNILGFDIQMPLSIKDAIPSITGHVTTHSDDADSGAWILRGKREDGAGTETESGRITMAHDGAGVNDQLAYLKLGVNTGSGVVDVMKLDSNLLATFAGNIVIPDAGYIGSASDTDAIQVEADGDVVLSQDLAVTGTVTASTITLGSVMFAGASGVISQDNSNLFWDDINKRLKVKGDIIYHGTSYILSGMSEDRQDMFLTTSAGNVFFEMEKIGGGDIEYLFDEIEYDLDCTTGSGTGGRAQVQLTEGSATNPQINYVYITLVASTATLTASTSLPTGQFAWVALIVIQSDTEVAAADGGPLAYQRFTETYKHDSRGSLSHMREKIRYLGADYLGGMAQSLTIAQNGGADTVVLTTASGKVYQLHRQDWPVYDISSKGIWVANASGTGVLTKYQRLTDLNSILETADGTVIGNNKRFNLVIWGSINFTTGDCKMFVNLPTGVYQDNDQTISDENGTAVTTIPTEFQTTGFLIARLPLKYSTGGDGTWTNLMGGTSVIDLRGLPTGFNLGSGATVGATATFSDADFEIFDNGDDTRRLMFQVSGVSGGNTRTLTVPNVSGTLVTSANPEDLGGVLQDLNTLGAVGANSEFLVGTAAGVLAWESGDTVRASLGLTGGTSTVDDSESNMMLKDHAYLTQTAGFVNAYTVTGNSSILRGFVDSDDDPATGGIIIDRSNSASGGGDGNPNISFFVALGKYFEITHATQTVTIIWTPLVAGGGAPIDQD